MTHVSPPETQNLDRVPAKKQWSAPTVSDQSLKSITEGGKVNSSNEFISTGGS